MDSDRINAPAETVQLQGRCSLDAKVRGSLGGYPASSGRGGRAAAAWATRLAEDAGFDPAARELVAVARVLDAIYRGGIEGA